MGTLIGYDYREIDYSGYRGIDRDIWPTSDSYLGNSIELKKRDTNGLNLYDKPFVLPNKNETSLVCFYAKSTSMEQIVTTFGVNTGDSAQEKPPEGFAFIGYDVVDLYVQETFLMHVDLKGHELNASGLLDSRNDADALASNINDEFIYDVLGVWVFEGHK